ncbi:uncharacterized protein LOC126791786 [Argentina anserina]|uniref:uncharacterized protein LOC126791786 n=1 Tax=Argentina anserina TaxID=57926 RepID=UPI0021769358|nr:uncharacterized protein LOC126791786 [Potentilla anserina]
MECNKDEGIRAKEIAERKFNDNDIVGAKKFALKAQSLYPGIDGIQKLLATLDVYICAENKIGGEADWYSILGVSPEADNETVKKQFKTLALSLHPDRNKSVGAGGAFNLLKNALDLLSDKAKRADYDMRRNVVHQNVSTTNRATKGANGSFHQKVSTMQSSQGANGSAYQNVSTGAQGSHGANASVHQKGSTAQSSQGVNDYDHQKVRTGAQGSHEANGSTSKGRGSNAKAQTGTKRPAPSSGPASVKPIPTSFWSECPKCKMRFEYAGRHLMSNVFCVDCNKLFQLVEMVPPAATCGSNSKIPFCAGSTPASENIGETEFISHVSFTQKSVHWTPFSRAAGASQASRVDSKGRKCKDKRAS